MERGQRRISPQPHTGQPQRPAQRPTQRPPQRRPVQSTRPAQPSRPVNRNPRGHNPKVLGIIIATFFLALILVVIIGTSGDKPDVTANNTPTQNPTSAPTINPDDIKRNTTAMVDYLIAEAREPASNENAKANAENCYNWIVENVDAFFTDNLTMEKAIYAGALVEYYYTGKDDIRAGVGMDAVQAVKYVYRGVETALDDATQENIRQIKDGIEKDRGN